MTLTTMAKSYSSREEFNRKAQRINKVLQEWNAVGFRSGYMLRNLEWISELDITYDASTFDTDPLSHSPTVFIRSSPFGIIPVASGRDTSSCPIPWRKIRPCFSY